MKKVVIHTLRILMIIAGLSLSQITYSQNAPPPPPTSGGAEGTGGTSDQRTGGAPIGGGLFILLGLGAAYGGKKLYDLRKEKLEE